MDNAMKVHVKDETLITLRNGWLSAETRSVALCAILALYCAE
jgi:hypothetical protein